MQYSAARCSFCPQQFLVGVPSRKPGCAPNPLQWLRFLVQTRISSSAHIHLRDCR